MLMLIFQFILFLQSQSIDFKDSFSEEDIPSGDPVFIEFIMDFKSNGGKHDVVLMLKKILYVQTEDARLWYEKL